MRVACAEHPAAQLVLLPAAGLVHRAISSKRYRDVDGSFELDKFFAAQLPAGLPRLLCSVEHAEIKKNCPEAGLSFFWSVRIPSKYRRAKKQTNAGPPKTL